MTLSRIPEGEIDKVKRNSNIVRVIQSRVVKVEKRGSNYAACCPFHKEKTPSFFVDPDKGVYNCFGCGASGDVFTFVQEYDNVSFPEAVRIVAHEENILISDDDAFSKVVLENLRKRRDDDLLLARKKKFPGKKGGKSEDNPLALKSVPFPSFCFPLGDPRCGKLNDYVRDVRGMDPQVLGEEYGVMGCIAGYYKDRIILPVFRSGELVFYQGRDITGEARAKYIGPKGVSSGDCLFNLDRARKHETVFLCEGWFSAKRVGDDATATFSNNLTDTQIRLLKVYQVKDVCLVYDPDSWHINENERKRNENRRKKRKLKAPVKRALVKLLKAGFNVSYVRLHQGDPDEVGKKYGEGYLRTFLEKGRKRVYNEMEVNVLFMKIEQEQ